MAKEIQAYKLINGDEIIGTLTGGSSGGDGTYKVLLEKVRSVQMMQHAPGQVGVALIPYSAITIDGDIEFYSTAIAAEIKQISKEMEDAYLQQTSGIQLAGQMPHHPPKRK